MTFKSLGTHRVLCDYDQPHLCDSGLVIHSDTPEDAAYQLRQQGWRIDSAGDSFRPKTYCPQAKHLVPEPGQSKGPEPQ